MSTVTYIKEKISQTFPKSQAKVLSELVDIVDETVKVKDFNELKSIVADLATAQKELAEAQKRTEQRVEELVEAQKRTEQRVEELAEAQKRTEQRVEELVEAQKRTEQRVEELAEAQKRTEQRVEELAEVQKNILKEVSRLDKALIELTEAHKDTQKTVKRLTEELKETRREVGGLTITVGYNLENKAYKALPSLLKRDYEIDIIDRLKRKYLVDKEGKYLEVNIVGTGLKDGKKINIIGESKSQLSINHVKKFIKDRIERLNKVYPNIFPLLVTHMISQPDVEEFAKKSGIAIYYSYDIEG